MSERVRHVRAVESVEMDSGDLAIQEIVTLVESEVAPDATDG